MLIICHMFFYTFISSLSPGLRSREPGIGCQRPLDAIPDLISALMTTMTCRGGTDLDPTTTTQRRLPPLLLTTI